MQPEIIPTPDSAAPLGTKRGEPKKRGRKRAFELGVLPQPRENTVLRKPRVIKPPVKDLIYGHQLKPHFTDVRAVPKIKLRYGDKIILVQGWESGFALGVVKHWEGDYVSVMLLSGVILTRGFPQLRQAHEFNVMVLRHNDMFVGTPFLDEFYERSGGKDAAARVVEELKQLVLKRTYET